MTETRAETHEIRKENLPRLEKRLARVQKKARKYGLPVPELKILSEGTRPVLNDFGVETGFTVPVLEVLITGQAPVLDGDWNFVAVIDHRIVPHDELGWTIFTLPYWNGVECYLCEGRGEVDDYIDTSNEDKITCDECFGEGRIALKVPREFHDEPPWCDHCDLSRDRAETFLIVDDRGEWKRVGRQCLKDYLGGIPLHAYAMFLYDLPNIAFGLPEEPKEKNEYLDTIMYVEHVAAAVDYFGWKSRSDSDPGDATADIALASIEDARSDDKGLDVTKAHGAVAKAALDWARDALPEKDDLNDYEYNLVIAASQQATHYRRVGLIASVIRAWELELARRDRADNSNSQHVGELKERLDLTLTVQRQMTVEIPSFNGRGTDYLKIHVFNDEDGNVFVWKTTSQRLGEGETFVGRGTVKEHTDYEGIAQTTLTRCKLVHEPCGELDYWFDDDGWTCLDCTKEEK